MTHRHYELIKIRKKELRAFRLYNVVNVTYDKAALGYMNNKKKILQQCARKNKTATIKMYKSVLFNQE